MVKCGRGPETVTELGGEIIRKLRHVHHMCEGPLSTKKIGTMKDVNLNSEGPHSTETKNRKWRMSITYFRAPTAEKIRKWRISNMCYRGPSAQRK